MSTKITWLNSPNRIAQESKQTQIDHVLKRGYDNTVVALLTNRQYRTSALQFKTYTQSVNHPIIHMTGSIGDKICLEGMVHRERRKITHK